MIASNGATERDLSQSFPCPKCAYDLRGSSSERCPECGVNIALALKREHGWYGLWRGALRAAIVLGILCAGWLYLYKVVNDNRWFVSFPSDLYHPNRAINILPNTDAGRAMRAPEAPYLALFLATLKVGALLSLRCAWSLLRWIAVMTITNLALSTATIKERSLKKALRAALEKSHLVIVADAALGILNLILFSAFGPYMASGRLKMPPVDMLLLYSASEIVLGVFGALYCFFVVKRGLRVSVLGGLLVVFLAHVVSGGMGSLLPG